jgi:hypothetical protein
MIYFNDLTWRVYRHAHINAFASPNLRLLSCSVGGGGGEIKMYARTSTTFSFALLSR